MGTYWCQLIYLLPKSACFRCEKLSMRKLNYLFQVSGGTLFEALGCQHPHFYMELFRTVRKYWRLDKRTGLVIRIILFEDLFSCFLAYLFFTDQHRETVICISACVSLRPLQYSLFIQQQSFRFPDVETRVHGCTSGHRR